jgi:ABC-type nitrate/sulfonate/bicarbonate transport system substrate-binding protein
MKSSNRLHIPCLLLATLLSAHAEKAELLTYKPLADAAKAPLKQVTDDRTVPVIAWGADVATQLAVSNGSLAGVKLVREDNFPKQVTSCLGGKSPYLRGTLPMVLQARKAFQDAGTDLLVIYQLSWSNGGDCLVVRDRVKSIKDIKSVAIQLYGPHEHPAIKVMEDAGVDPAKVKFHYLPELAAPTDGGKRAIVSPPEFFEANGDVDAVWVISPDAAALTEGDYAVKGARILFTSKQASRIIPDVYAVRKDYFEQNRGKVESFVRTLLKSEEALRDLVADKDKRGDEYRKLMSASAGLLLGDSGLVGDTEGMLSEAELTGHSGNVAFFTGKGTTRSLATLTEEVQVAFRKAGRDIGRFEMPHAQWDWVALSAGLKYAGEVKIAKSVFKSGEQAQQKVEEFLQQNPELDDRDTALFDFTVPFAANEDKFDANDPNLRNYFSQAMSMVDAYAGTTMIIEAHADGYLLQRLRDALRTNDKALLGKIQTVLKMASPPTEQTATLLERSLKTKSAERAGALRDSFLEYSKSRGLELDDNRIVAVGRGAAAPIFENADTPQKRAENRRGVIILEKLEVLEVGDDVKIDF